MPIVAITTKTKTPGSWGTLAEIARRLQVSRVSVSRANKNPRFSQRIAAALEEFQRTGRLPEDTRKPPAQSRAQRQRGAQAAQ